MASAQQTTVKWQPNGKSSGRNSGTKGSVNDRDCASCGAVREHPQKTANYPQKVYCWDCHRAEGITNTTLRMRANKEETEEADRLRREGGARGNDSKVAAGQERVAAKVAGNPPATQREIDAEYDELVDQIKGGRPAAGGLFWRRLCGLVCLCNCAICLLAVLYSPTVFMVFCYLCGCIPAKKGDIVAIPKVYIEWAVAVVTLMDKLHPGQRDPTGFCGIKALQTRHYGRYDANGNSFDSNYDKVKRVYQFRVSVCAGANEDTLMPGAIYDKERDWLAVFSSESAGNVRGVAVLKIPLLIKDDRGRYRKTVVEAKCRRRQFVMAYLFTSVLAALSWGPLARDFAVLKERAEDPVTIGVQISIISDPTRTHIRYTHRRRSTRSSRRASSLGRRRSGCWGRSRRFTPPSSRRCTSFYWSWAAGGCRRPRSWCRF